MPKCKATKLLPHEQALLGSGDLRDVTHKGSTSRWLTAPSTSRQDLPEGHTLVYRPMGDAEVHHLLQYNELPSTQPYQAIIEGTVGRVYAEKYLRGHKKVDTSPTTVVEFCITCELVDTLMNIQHKVEDGAISMGLGDKAGGGLPLFNNELSRSPLGFRIVLVKRRTKR